VRKLEPLARAIAGAEVWLTGLRAEQSAFRATTPFLSRDEANGLVKAAPLADWSRAQVEAYIVEHAIPYNVLHDRGFPSIGCAPCTRAVRVGEPERAGRWWWEAEDKKECGLHGRPGYEHLAQPSASEG
jgi:phosphoadenosine phosphosulfate reductase